MSAAATAVLAGCIPEKACTNHHIAGGARRVAHAATASLIIRMAPVTKITALLSKSDEGIKMTPSDEPDSAMCDYNVAAHAVAHLRAHANRSSPGAGKPLFLGVGFRDNHLKWVAPARLRALFDPAALSIASAAHRATPDFAGGVPKVAWQYPADFLSKKTYTNITVDSPLPGAVVHEALRSYLAAIAFTDEQLGKVLGAVEEVGYGQNSLVLFTSDHGQNLGEHNTWCKMTAWEHSLRIPLLVRVPWLPVSAGKTHAGMAELVDLYRTLSDLAGAAEVEAGVEGESLAPAFSDPSSAGQPYAFSQTQRVSVPSLRKEPLPRSIYRELPAEADAYFDPSCFSNNSQLEWMGYTVRAAHWRYTEWYAWNGTAPIVRDGAPAELYDHTLDTSAWDPDVAEYDNVVALLKNAQTVLGGEAQEGSARGCARAHKGLTNRYAPVVVVLRQQF